jgi:hypothetical protein
VINRMTRDAIQENRSIYAVLDEAMHSVNTKIGRIARMQVRSQGRVCDARK